MSQGQFLHTVARKATLLLTVSTFALACSSDREVTSGFRIGHEAHITGIVLSSDLQPVHYAAVVVRLAGGNPDLAHGVIEAHTRTDRTGNFSARLQRLAIPGQVLSPDTASVRVYAYPLEEKHGGSKLQTEAVVESTLVTFVPFGQSPPSKRVTMRFAPPNLGGESEHPNP